MPQFSRAPPAVGEGDINAPAMTIVKQQPLYAEANSGDTAAHARSGFVERCPPSFAHEIDAFK
jgi:hypothetical protein